MLTLELKVAKNGNYVAWPKLPKMSIFIDLICFMAEEKWHLIFIDLKVAKNGFMTEVAKNGNKWLHIIAKNGMERSATL